VHETHNTNIEPMTYCLNCSTLTEGVARSVYSGRVSFRIFHKGGQNELFKYFLGGRTLSSLYYRVGLDFQGGANKIEGGANAPPPPPPEGTKGGGEE